MRNKNVAYMVKTHFLSYPHAFPLQNESMQWRRLSLLWKSFIALGEKVPVRGETEFSSPFLHASRFCIKQTVMQHIYFH